MNFGTFTNPVKNVFSTAKNSITSTFGGGNADQKAAPIDPAVQAIKDQQMNRAKDYRANLSGMKQENTQRAQIDARQGLAKNLSTVNTNYNNRGLLFSGLRAQGETDAGTMAANQASQQTAQGNAQLENNADALDNQAIGTGLGVQGLQQQNSQDAYNRAMGLRQQQFGLIGQAAGTIGSVAGKAAMAAAI